MKKAIIFFIAITLGTMSIHAQSGMDQFKVQVDGLGCPFCAYGLEKKFKEFKGIKKVKIDIETGDFSFLYPSEKQLSLEAVENQVVKAGYTPITGEVTRADGAVERMGDQNQTVSKETLLSQKSTFVAGNCGMCQARIEKAAKTVKGVAEASWDKETKMLQISFDQKQTNLSEIEKAIAAVGHDTKKFKADSEVYKNLPPCCLYERIQ